MSGSMRPLIRCGRDRPGAGAMPALRAHVLSRGEVMVVRLVGELDDVAAAWLEERLLTLLTEVPSVMVLDLSDLSVRGQALEHLLDKVAAQNRIWPRVPIVRAGALSGLPRPHPRPRRTTPLPAAPLAASRARAIVMRQCDDRDVGDLAGPAQLVASELVTNAVRHAGCGIRFTVESDEQALTVEVRDADPAPPRMREPDPLDEHGRGLGVVSASVTTWGCLPTRPGKVVWAAWALDHEYADACSSSDAAELAEQGS